ncbi:glutathione S-transferase [Xylaria digitata]|nr:glutathione S-transferase [Xylaria digitata]
MAPSLDLPIVLYHYDLSPYAKRVIWYLNLRKIPYSQCLQPPVMPRRDLALLGVSYRRIPVLSIGRDVYLDTRLIIQKLETLYPPSDAHPGISGAHAGSAEHTAIEQLISARTIEGDLFMRGVQCLPPVAFADPALQRDRAALNGIDVDKPGAVSPLSPEVMRRQRPAALAVVRRWVRWLEDGLLSDGRKWILDSRAGPSLADIEAVWVLHWIAAALPPEVLGAESAPKVAAWLKRFRGATAEAAGAPASLKGEDAARLIAGSPYAEPEGDVLRGELVGGAEGLSKGRLVRMWPTDYGFSHKDAGKLVAVDDKEFVIESEGKFGSVRIHAPRHGFTISADDGRVSSKI